MNIANIFKGMASSFGNNLKNNKEKIILDFEQKWMNSKSEFTDENIANDKTEITFDGNLIKYHEYTNEKSRFYERYLFNIAFCFEKEKSEFILNKAKIAMKKIEKLLNKEPNDLNEILILELNKIYYYHYSWIYGNNYEF